MESCSKLILLFAAYSFFGWLMETFLASLSAKKFINRGFLYGPFCPIYGFGAIMSISLSEWASTAINNTYFVLLLSLILSILMVTALEYCTGYVLEKIFNCKWWDYSNEPANLNGYICLKYSLLWGFLIYMMLQIVHPVINEQASSISGILTIYMAFFLMGYFLLDTAKSVTATLDLRRVVLDYSNISLNRYYDEIIKYQRIFIAFPRLLFINAGNMNRDLRTVLNDKLDKIKIELTKKAD